MKPGGAGAIINLRNKMSGVCHQSPKHAPTLFRDPQTRGPVLCETMLFQTLKGNPAQLACVKLAFGQMLQRPPLGRAEGEVRAFSMATM